MQPVSALVPPADSTDNASVRDVIGNKGDTLLGSSLVSIAKRDVGEVITQSVQVTGTGAIVAPLLVFTGAVEIVEQYAHLTAVTTLTNATDVYADIWDGTTATKLTSGAPGGAVLSAFEVGSFFTKGEDDSQPYTVFRANQARSFEPTYRLVSQPFVINAKAGATNQIRFHLTTTDAPVDFTMHIHFGYRALHEDSSLAFL